MQSSPINSPKDNRMTIASAGRAMRPKPLIAAVGEAAMVVVAYVVAVFVLEVDRFRS